mmetsp:Transcript_87069/g.186649  ORF Transcript_87069/g.186649 Transcript_87069/m.186649 type:complete len:219 (+) Transcript_87069:161-817(+)
MPRWSCPSSPALASRLVLAAFARAPRGGPSPGQQVPALSESTLGLLHTSRTGASTSLASGRSRSSGKRRGRSTEATEGVVEACITGSPCTASATLAAATAPAGSAMSVAFCMAHSPRSAESNASTVEPGGERLPSSTLSVSTVAMSLPQPASASGASSVALMEWMLFFFLFRFWHHLQKTIQSMQFGKVLILRPSLSLTLSPLVGAGLSLSSLFMMYS